MAPEAHSRVDPLFLARVGSVGSPPLKVVVGLWFSEICHDGGLVSTPPTP